MAVFSDEDVRKAITHCLGNARNLVAEARILYEASRYPRAYFLAVTALEEIGKVTLLVAHLGGRLTKPSQLRTFHQHFLDRRYLLASTLLNVDLKATYGIKETFKDHLSFSQWLGWKSKDLLQVQVYEEAGFTFPDERIAKEDTEGVIRLVESRIEIERERTAHLKKHEDLTNEEKGLLDWLHEQSEDREYLAFMNSPVALDKLGSAQDIFGWLKTLKALWEDQIAKDASRIRITGEGDMRWYVEADFWAYSHTVGDQALQWWNEHSDRMKLRKIDSKKMTARFVLPELRDDNELYQRATMIALLWLISLNVGSFGHFWWPPPAWPFPYRKLYDLKRKTNVSISFNRKSDKQWNDGELTVQDMRRTAHVFVGLNKLDPVYFQLYSMAATLLTAETIEFNFYTEVFSNFYRLIERFVKVALFKEKAGKLELDKLKKGLLQLGISQPIVDEFGELYKVRGRDAMHALGKEKELTFEEAGKCKIICDVMLYKYCEREVKELAAMMERTPPSS